jgi:hypothetical protein
MLGNGRWRAVFAALEGVASASGATGHDAWDPFREFRINPMDKMRTKTNDRLRGFPLSISQELFCKTHAMPKCVGHRTG